MSALPLDKDAFIQYCADNYALVTDFGPFCLDLFPEQFPRPFSVVHDSIIRQLVSNDKKICALAPRGIGKTTLVRHFIIQQMLFGRAKFVVYVSNSQALAEMQTENIKFALTTNEFIRKGWGDPSICADNPDSTGETFSKLSWSAYGRTFVLPRGMGQQIRGLNWHGFRPDLIVLDDPEKRDELMNEEIRKNVRLWFFGDVTYAVDNAGDYRIIYIDTLKHEDALPTYLERLPDWSFQRLTLCDDKFNSLAPDFRSTEQIKIDMANMQSEGMLDIFYQENMNQVIAPETASFSTKYFKYYDEMVISGLDANSETVLLVDPARTNTPQSDYTAIVIVTIDYTGHRIFVRDAIGGHYYEDEFHQMIVNLTKLYKAHTIGVEGLKESAIGVPLQTALTRAGCYAVDLIPLKPEGRNKEFRTRALIPFYRTGIIWHSKANCFELEQQLLSFPRGRRDDLRDALAYVCDLLAVHGFTGTASAAASEVADMDLHKTRSEEQALLEEERELALLDAEDSDGDGVDIFPIRQIKLPCGVCRC